MERLFRLSNVQSVRCWRNQDSSASEYVDFHTHHVSTYRTFNLFLNFSNFIPITRIFTHNIQDNHKCVQVCSFFIGKTHLETM